MSLVLSGLIICVVAYLAVTKIDRPEVHRSPTWPVNGRSWLGGAASAGVSAQICSGRAASTQSGSASAQTFTLLVLAGEEAPEE